jgi:hypothetical protein
VEPWYPQLALAGATLALGFGACSLLFRRRAVRIAIAVTACVMLGAIAVAVLFLALPETLPDADVGPGIILVELFAAVGLAVDAATRPDLEA